MGMYNQNDGRQSRYDNRPTNNNSWVGRLVVAAVIALVGLFMYWSNTQINPITGEKQHVSLSPKQEIALGLQSAPQMAREMGGELPASDPRDQTVKRVGKFLVDNTAAKNSPWNFEFHLLADDQTVNAFALPGGQIFITLALYSKLQNEAQLAGVLGHEMGHVIERHTSEQMAKNQLGQFLVYAFGTGVSSNSGNYSMNPTVIAQFVNQMMQLKYGRQDESEADTWGIKILSKVGFNPYAMVEVMKVLKAATAGRGPQQSEIFQSHPNPDLRIQQINDYLKANPPKPGLTDGEALPQGGGSYGRNRGLFGIPGW